VAEKGEPCLGEEIAEGMRGVHLVKGRGGRVLRFETKARQYFNEKQPNRRTDQRRGKNEETSDTGSCEACSVLRKKGENRGRESDGRRSKGTRGINRGGVRRFTEIKKTYSLVWGGGGGREGPEKEGGKKPLRER